EGKPHDKPATAAKTAPLTSETHTTVTNKRFGCPLRMSTLAITDSWMTTTRNSIPAAFAASAGISANRRLCRLCRHNRSVWLDGALRHFRRTLVRDQRGDGVESREVDVRIDLDLLVQRGI